MRKNTYLIIEDRQDIAELLEFNLESNEYKTSIAYNGELGQAPGLAIVNHVAFIYDGYIFVESHSESGTKFTKILPT